MKSLKIGSSLGVILIAAAMGASAQPSSKSLAEIEVCLESDTTAFVCSSKDLSNVILQCTSGEGEAQQTFFHKIDDLDALLVENPSEGSFTCPEGSLVQAVFVKSGSGKGNVAGLSAGAGEAYFSPGICPVTCPAPAADDESEGDSGDEGTGSEEGESE